MSSNSLTNTTNNAFDTVLDFPIMFGIIRDGEEAEFIMQERPESYQVESDFATLLSQIEMNHEEQSQQTYETMDVKASQTVNQTNLKQTKQLKEYWIPEINTFQMEVQVCGPTIDIINYNKSVAQIKKKSGKKITSKNRILDIFFPKFKQYIKNHLLEIHPWLNENIIELKLQLNNLPGMKKIKNMKMLVELLSVKVIYGVEVNVCELATSYLSINQALLDALFPLQNKTGEFRVNRLGKQSINQIVDYLPIYEMMSKIHNSDQETKNNYSLQNIWYYSNTTPQVYQYFDKQG